MISTQTSITATEIVKAWNTPDAVKQVYPEQGCPSCGSKVDKRKAWEGLQEITAYVCDACRIIGHDPRPNYNAALLEWMTCQ